MTHIFRDAYNYLDMSRRLTDNPRQALNYRILRMIFDEPQAPVTTIRANDGCAFGFGFFSFSKTSIAGGAGV